MFRYLILGLLRSGVPYHGYALMKEYRERSGLQVSTGNFYRELQRLVAEGLVRTATNPYGADPRRAPYEITESGAIAFDAWLVAPTETTNGLYEDELSSRALFVAEADVAVVQRALDRWHQELWFRGKIVERAREVALARRGDDRQQSFAPLALLLARRLKYVAADLEFLDELRAAYEQWVTPPQAVPQARARAAPAVRPARRRPQGPPRRPGRK